MSEKAFKHALSIAKTFDAELLLLTVIPENVVSTGAYAAWLHPSVARRSSDEIMKVARQEATGYLDRKMKQCKKNGVKASYRILEGDAAMRIIQIADNLKVDLIIIGSVGIKGIRILRTLGSVSRKVAEGVSYPVLVIR